MKKISKAWPLAITFAVLVIFCIELFFEFFACGWAGNNIYRCDILPPIINFLLLFLLIVGIILVFKKKTTWLAFLPVIIVSVLIIGLLLVPGGEINKTKFACSMADSSNERTCWTNFAVEEHNFNYCDNMQSDIGMNLCYGKVAKYPGDASWCEKIPLGHGGFDSCYQNIAVYTQDKTWCDNLNRSTYYKYPSQTTSSIFRCYTRVNEAINQTS